MSMREVEAALAPLIAAGLVVRASGAVPVTVRATAEFIPLGLAAVDAALPGGGLARAAVHEFAAAPGDAAARALAVIVAGRAGGPVLWIQLARDAQEQGHIYPYGLATLGLDPDRVFAVTATTAQDALWAMEESLRAGCAGAVIGDGLAPDLTASRRLLLAAERGSGPALVVRPMDAEFGVGAGLVPAQRRMPQARTVTLERRIEGGDTGRIAAIRPTRPYIRSTNRSHASAAATVWRVASAASTDDAGPGAPHWELTLTRCRGGRTPRSWLVEWDGARLVASTAKPARVAPLITDTARRAG